MRESYFEQKGQSSQDKKIEKRGSIFEIRKRIKGFGISIGIEQSEQPVSGNIDFENKEANIRVTPEGIRKGFNFIKDFLNDPERQEKLDKIRDKMNEKTEERKDKAAEQTIKDYAKQEEKEEVEIIKEILDEFVDDEDEEDED